MNEPIFSKLVHAYYCWLYYQTSIQNVIFKLISIYFREYSVNNTLPWQSRAAKLYPILYFTSLYWTTVLTLQRFRHLNHHMANHAKMQKPNTCITKKKTFNGIYLLIYWGRYKSIKIYLYVNWLLLMMFVCSGYIISQLGNDLCLNLPVRTHF